MKKIKKKEIIALRAIETVATSRFTQDIIKTLKTLNTLITPPNIKLNNGLNIAKPVQKRYAQIVVSSLIQT